MSETETSGTPKSGSEAARFPIVLRGLCVILSLVVGLSSAAGVWYGVTRGEELLLGFEICVLFACVFGVLTGFGKFGVAPALSMFIVGGTVLTGATLSVPAFSSVIETGSVSPNAPGAELLPAVYARLACAMVFFGLSALTVLAQRPSKSIPLLVKGLILAVPLGGVVALVVVPSLRSAVFGLNGILLAAVAVVSMLVVIGFVAASGHYLIRAFEMGFPEHRDKAN